MIRFECLIECTHAVLDHMTARLYRKIPIISPPPKNKPPHLKFHTKSLENMTKRPFEQKPRGLLSEFYGTSFQLLKDQSINQTIILLFPACIQDIINLVGLRIESRSLVPSLSTSSTQSSVFDEIQTSSSLLDIGNVSKQVIEIEYFIIYTIGSVHKDSYIVELGFGFFQLLNLFYNLK